MIVSVVYFNQLYCNITLSSLLIYFMGYHALY